MIIIVGLVMNKSILTLKQLERYARNIDLKEVGTKGQKLLLDAKVLVIGAGGLGSPVLMYLSACGIGTIGVADGDDVDCSNLNRQIIHGENHVGIKKVISAKKAIHNMNQDVDVITYDAFITQENIGDVVANYDIVVDATDSVKSKLLINDACVLYNKPLVHAGVGNFEGMVMTILPGKSACYRCLINNQPPKEDVSESGKGILGVVPGVIGTIQATEVIKYIINKGELLADRLLLYNALTMEFDIINIVRNENCSCC